EGSYGSDVTTTMSYLPITLKYSASQWQAKVTLPWIEISSSGSPVVADGTIVSIANGTTSETTTVSGLGDVVAGFTWKLPAMGVNSDHFVDLGVSIKLSTADADKGLGSGATDYSVQIDYALATTGVMPFATLGYKAFGQPEDYALNAVWFVSLGAQVPLAKGRAVGLIWDGRQATTSSGSSKSETMFYLSQQLGERYQLTGYGVKGFTSASVDQEAGVQLSVKF
ncbi:MAG: hypothetical protein HQL49_00025, partial [Gammaproteobacteria bacterium]|nr:hypothetical protein [Gammaproteobacteria bacterium]